MTVSPNELRMRAQHIVRPRLLDLKGLPFHKRPAVIETINELNFDNKGTAMYLRNAAAEIERLQKLIPQAPTFHIVKALDGSYFMQPEKMMTNCEIVVAGMDYTTAKTLLHVLTKYNPARHNGRN